MIVECVGLPGAGKTTVCKLVSEPHGGKGVVPLTALRFNLALLRAGWHILALCLAARPFGLNRMKRGINLILFLRHYEQRGLNILLDQGIIQKIWSLLADATRYPHQRFARVIASLSPFAPDRIVWFETPLDSVVQRLSARKGGNSRYDGLPPDEALLQLKARRALLHSVAQQFCRTAGARLLELDGSHPPAANAAKIDALFKGQHV